MRNLKQLFKSKKGEVVEAVILVPLWLMVLLYLGYQMQFYETGEAVEDAGQVSSRYMAEADSLNSGITTINNYLNSREDGEYFYKLTANDTTQSYITKFWNKNGEELSIDEINVLNWQKGAKIEFVLKARAPYYDVTLNNFCPIGAENNECFQILESDIYTKIIVYIV